MYIVNVLICVDKWLNIDDMMTRYFQQLHLYSRKHLSTFGFDSSPTKSKSFLRELLFSTSVEQSYREKSLDHRHTPVSTPAAASIRQSWGWSAHFFSSGKAHFLLPIYMYCMTRINSVQSQNNSRKGRKPVL